MKDFIKKLFASLDNHSLGYSGRKLTALFAIIVAAYVTYTLPLDVRLYALYSWQGLALLCLGIVTIEQVIKFKNGITTTVTEQKNETKTEVVTEIKPD